MTRSSYNITVASSITEPPAEPDLSCPPVFAQSKDFALFEDLVREYCGIGFFECLGYQDSRFLTSAIWEESSSSPPRFCRIIVELLHRAAERENTR